MVGRNYIIKHFQKLSFEAQVAEITTELSSENNTLEQINEDSTEPEELLISKPESENKSKKRKTAKKKKKISKTSNPKSVSKKSLKFEKKKLLKDNRAGVRDNLEKYIEERNKRNPGFKQLTEEKVLLKQKEYSTIRKSIKEQEKEMIDIDIDIPDIPEEEEEVESTGIEDESGGSVVYGLIGAGQAGGRIVESFYGRGYKKTIAANTSDKDLAGLTTIPENQKIHMKSESGGAGKNMRLGEAAADTHLVEIYETMQKVFGKVDRILVCFGSGGGTGSGACLRFVEVAKKYLNYLGVSDPDKKVGVLATLPTKGECASPDIANNSHLVMTKLCELAKKELGFLLIFDNDKIKSKYPSLTVANFWKTVNSVVTGVFHSFNVLSTQTGMPTTFDPADYQRVLSAGGCMIMGMSNIKEYQDGSHISKAIRINLEKGLLCGGFNLATAKAAACIATAPADILENTPGLMVALEEGFDTLANLTGYAVIMRGIYQVNKPKFSILTMVTGLLEPTERLNELKRFQTNTKTTIKKSSLY